MRRFGLAGWLGPLFVLAAALSSTAVAAASPTVAVEPGDDPLKITAFIGDEAAFSGTVGLRGLEDTGKLSVHFSDLRSAEVVTDLIPRDQLTFAGVESLKQGEVADADVSVSGVSSPGTYRGTMRIGAAGSDSADEVTVDIEVDALEHPELTPVVPQDRVQGAFTRCGARCGLTEFIAGSAGAQSQSVRFTVADRQQAQVTSMHVIATGTEQGHQLTNEDLGLTSASVHQNGDVLTLDVRINPADLPADHYTGTLRLAVQDVAAAVTVPIDFTVRNAPYAALIALLIGILLGRLAAYMQGQGDKVLAAFRRATELEDDLRQVANEGRRAQAAQLIARARALLNRDQLDKATPLLDQAEALITATPAPATSDAPVTANQITLPAVSTRGIGSFIARWISPVNTELGLAAHVLGLVSLTAVLITGYETLYVQKGSTFGAHPMLDLVGLILWGLSADVASRGLGNLTGKTAAPQPST